MTKANSSVTFAIKVASGPGAGIALCLLAGLSPLAAADRPALSLLAVCISLPLGAVLAGPAARDTRQAGTDALCALAAGVLLGMVPAVGDPSLAMRCASWCSAGALTGFALGSVSRIAGLAATLGWLLLCGLPFLCGSLGAWVDIAEDWALQGCPWLGFAKDALEPDPLRLPVLYLGRWSSLTDQPALGLLSAAELWFAGLLALAAALLRAGLPANCEPGPASA